MLFGLQARTRGGGRGGRTNPPTPDPHPPTSNYRVPPAHRFHKYKLRLLYFRMQKLTPYSIKFIKKILEACPQTLLGRHCAGGARHSPPPQPINDPAPLLGQPWVRTWVGPGSARGQRLVKDSDSIELEGRGCCFAEGVAVLQKGLLFCRRGYCTVLQTGGCFNKNDGSSARAVDHSGPDK